MRKEWLRANLISSIFTFKSNAKKVFNKQNATNLLNYIKNQIIYHVKSELSNESKKANVDAFVINYIRKTFISKNIIVEFFVNQLIELVPIITQLVFNMLKSRVNGLTKEV